MLFIAQLIYPAISLSVKLGTGSLSANYYDSTPVLDNGQVADFDNNGVLDCVAEDWYCPDCVKIYLNGIFGGGTSSALDPFWDPAHDVINSVYAADFNGDGNDDVIFDSSRWGVESTHLFLGSGTGTSFQRIEINDTLARGGAIMMAGNLNGDNASDVIVKYGENLIVGLKIIPDSDPYFQWYNLTTDGIEVAIGDENGDALPDIFILKTNPIWGEGVYVLHGRSDNNFTLSTLQPTNILVMGGMEEHLVVGDFGGDGNTGVAVLLDSTIRMFMPEPDSSMAYDEVSSLNLGETYHPIGMALLPATTPGDAATLYVTALTPSSAIYVHGLHVTGAGIWSGISIQLALFSLLFYFGGCMAINLSLITLLDRFVYKTFGLTLEASRGRTGWIFFAPICGIGIFALGGMYNSPTSSVLGFLQLGGGALFWIIFAGATALWIYTCLRPYLKFYKASEDGSGYKQSKYEKEYAKEQKKAEKEAAKFAKEHGPAVPSYHPVAAASGADLSKPFQMQWTPAAPAPPTPVSPSAAPGVTPAPQNKPCPQCGNVLPAIARFCNKCGYQFN